MRCVVLNTYDVQGGAARAAYRLHRGLRRLGQDSWMISRYKRSGEPTVRQVVLPDSQPPPPYLRELALAQQFLIDRNRTEISNTFFSLPGPGYDLAAHPAVQRAEVINLHWVAGLLTPRSIARLAALGKPVVWTLHDQRAFTGGCHFSAGCRQYETDCSRCPQLRDNTIRLTEKVLAETLRLLPARALTVVTPSRWLAECARRSAVFRHSRVEPIPNSLELDVFQPLDKAEARRMLGLEPGAFYFLFGADSCYEKRKGFEDLLAAVALCLQDSEFKHRTNSGQIQFLSFGHLSEHQIVPGIKIKGLGHFDSDAALCLVYAAADVFLLSSLEDNLPNTVLEAMSCGTPVLASDVGGVPEMIAHEQTGYLVPVRQPPQYAQAMRFVSAHPEALAAWRERGLREVRSRYALETQARNYLALFEELVAGDRARAEPPVTGSETPGVKEAELAAPEAGGQDPAAPIVAVEPDEKPVALLEESLPVNKEEYMQPTIAPLELVWGSADGLEYKPSWRRPDQFLSAEHEQIWEKTKDLPGWQDPADSQKLYELARYCGGVILEIGVFGGRSAVVELLGANSAARGWTAQYYGVDVDPGFLERALPVVQKAGVNKQCFFYHGNLRQFHRDLPIVPTMVFVDGDHQYAGVRADLLLLKEFLAPGTPVLCHDYVGIEGVRRAIEEMLQTPYYAMAGTFAGSVLLRATEQCPGRVQGLPPELFESCRSRLLGRYLGSDGRPVCTGTHTPVLSLLRPARELLKPSGSSRVPSGRAPWPYSSLLSPDLPETLPDGQPWPKISIITPSFNQGQYIEQTILSVLNQKYPNLEYIVMDGGSTDGTREILERYRDRLTHCVSEKDRGQCHAINKGFALATGRICSWLNSDDLLAPGALAAIALAFHTSGADMVAGICQLHRDGEIISQHLTSCADGPLPLAQLLDVPGGWLKGQFFHQPEVFFSRALWEKAGGQLQESLYYSLDYELWLRFAHAGARLKVIGRPVAQFRVHEQQKTYSVDEFRPELESVRDDFMQRHALAAPAPRPERVEKQQLRVALFNDIGFLYGAGIGQYRLACALQAAGHEVIPIAFGRHNLPEFVQDRKSEQCILETLRKARPDVVLLGNLHAVGLSPGIIAQIATEFPTVSVLHDLWLLTGRCAYNGTCDKFLTGCDASCPSPTEYPALAPEKIGPAWQEKTRLLSECPQLTLAGNSGWMRRRIIERLSRLAAPGRAADGEAARLPYVGQVRFGVRLDVFKPRDKSVCREMLNLPQEQFLILFSCSNLEDPRKGVAHLVEALQILDLPDVTVVCVGHSEQGVRLELENLVHVSYSQDPLRLALLYSAADLFVGAALEEAFGQVFVEAAACGTPSVAYPVGGVPEALADGISGYLAETVEPAALAKVIGRLYGDPALRRRLSVCGRILVENEFSFAAAYHQLSHVLRAALATGQVHLTPKISPQLQLGPLPPITFIHDLLRHGVTGLARLLEGKTVLAPVPDNEPTALWTASQRLTVADGSRAVARKQQTFEAQAAEFFQEQLNRYRRSKVPWVLRPGAWIARYNRNLLSKQAEAKAKL